MSLRPNSALLLVLPAVALSGCFWDSEPAPADTDPLAPAVITGTTSTGGLTASGGQTIRPTRVYRSATGTFVEFSDDRQLFLTRTGVIALDSGYKVVGNGEVVAADGNQLGYMAAGDTLNIDAEGKIDWVKAETGSASSGATASGAATATGRASATGTILSATGKLSATGTLHAPMLDPESGAIGPDSDDSHR